MIDSREFICNWLLHSPLLIALSSLHVDIAMHRPGNSLVICGRLMRPVSGRQIGRQSSFVAATAEARSLLCVILPISFSGPLLLSGIIFPTPFTYHALTNAIGRRLGDILRNDANTWR